MPVDAVQLNTTCDAVTDVAVNPVGAAGGCAAAAGVVTLSGLDGDEVPALLVAATV